MLSNWTSLRFLTSTRDGMPVAYCCCHISHNRQLQVTCELLS